MGEIRICTQCNRTKYLSEFRGRISSSGNRCWRWKCRDCERIAVRQYNLSEVGRAANRRCKAKRTAEGYFKEYRSRPDVIARVRYNGARRRADPLARMKAKARSLADWAVTKGELQQQPCASCGAPQSEKHHPDYQEPLLIVWLCHPCHMKLNRIRGKMPEEE